MPILETYLFLLIWIKGIKASVFECWLFFVSLTMLESRLTQLVHEKGASYVLEVLPYSREYYEMTVTHGGEVEKFESMDKDTVLSAAIGFLLMNGK